MARARDGRVLAPPNQAPQATPATTDHTGALNMNRHTRPALRMLVQLRARVRLRRYIRRRAAGLAGGLKLTPYGRGT